MPEPVVPALLSTPPASGLGVLSALQATTSVQGAGFAEMWQGQMAMPALPINATPTAATGGDTSPGAQLATDAAALPQSLQATLPPMSSAKAQANGLAGARSASAPAPAEASTKGVAEPNNQQVARIADASMAMIATQTGGLSIREVSSEEAAELAALDPIQLTPQIAAVQMRDRIARDAMPPVTAASVETDPQQAFQQAAAQLLDATSQQIALPGEADTAASHGIATTGPAGATLGQLPAGTTLPGLDGFDGADTPNAQPLDAALNSVRPTTATGPATPLTELGTAAKAAEPAQAPQALSTTAATTTASLATTAPQKTVAMGAPIAAAQINNSAAQPADALLNGATADNAAATAALRDPRVSPQGVNQLVDQASIQGADRTAAQATTSKGGDGLAQGNTAAATGAAPVSAQPATQQQATQMAAMPGNAANVQAPGIAAQAAGAMTPQDLNVARERIAGNRPAGGNNGTDPLARLQAMLPAGQTAEVKLTPAAERSAAASLPQAPGLLRAAMAPGAAKSQSAANAAPQVLPPELAGTTGTEQAATGKATPGAASLAASLAGQPTAQPPAAATAGSAAPNPDAVVSGLTKAATASQAGQQPAQQSGSQPEQVAMAAAAKTGNPHLAGSRMPQSTAPDSRIATPADPEVTPVQPVPAADPRMTSQQQQTAPAALSMTDGETANATQPTTSQTTSQAATHTTSQAGAQSASQTASLAASQTSTQTTQAGGTAGNLATNPQPSGSGSATLAEAPVDGASSQTAEGTRQVMPERRAEYDTAQLETGREFKPADPLKVAQQTTAATAATAAPTAPAPGQGQMVGAEVNQAQPLQGLAQANVTASAEASQPQTAASQGAPLSRTLMMDDREWPSQLTSMIREARDLTQGDIEIALQPERLGRMTIKMEMRDNAVSVTIVTDNDSSARLLNDNQARLADLMSKAGLDLTQHQASSGQQGREHAGFGSQTGGNGANGQGSDQDQQTGTAQLLGAEATSTSDSADDSGIDIIA